MLLAFAVSPTLCLLGGVQVLGVVAAGVSRLAEGTRHERLGHGLCLTSLAIIGTVCFLLRRVSTTRFVRHCCVATRSGSAFGSLQSLAVDPFVIWSVLTELAGSQREWPGLSMGCAVSGANATGGS
jgi:hypothetical protein